MAGIDGGLNMGVGLVGGFERSFPAFVIRMSVDWKSMFAAAVVVSSGDDSAMPGFLPSAVAYSYGSRSYFSASFS